MESPTFVLVEWGEDAAANKPFSAELYVNAYLL